MAALQDVFTIPVTNIPQVFQITLAGTVYNMTCKWNDTDDAGWALDIADQNEVPLACNIPLITGDNLLDGLEYLGIEGELYVLSTGTNQFAVPTLENLGVDAFLYFVTDEAA